METEANSLGGAQLVATAGGQIYTEEVGYNQTYFYWVRFVSVRNVPSAFNDTEGTSAQTAVDVGTVLTTLGENLLTYLGIVSLTGLISAANAEEEAARVIKSSSAPTTRADGSSIQPNDIWYIQMMGKCIHVIVLTMLGSLLEMLPWSTCLVVLALLVVL